MPGFLGTPAGMTTISAPTRESLSWSSPIRLQIELCYCVQGSLILSSNILSICSTNIEV